MTSHIYDTYCQILREELIPALGCTEPIAIAYGAAMAKKLLGQMPEHIQLDCSGNIIKNVKSVTVPNSNGLRGLEAAAILGAVGGDPELKLEVLSSVTPEAIAKTQELLKTDICTCGLVEGVANLYILVTLTAGDKSAVVEIRDQHTNITKMVKNGQVLLEKEADNAGQEQMADRSLLNLQDILTFADTVDLKDVQDLLERQIRLNSAISEEGLKHTYGVEVGRSILEYYDPSDVKVRARAAAAAGSDARMNGCSMPVVINSGSGNQGITVSMPVVEYAKNLGASQEKLYRALVVSNLVAVLQKCYIGRLSAFCGAVNAATGAACGVAYLNGDGYDVISRTITNSLCNVGGIVCDGAKSSCAAKIAAAVDAALLGYSIAKEGRAFGAGEGLVKENAEKTIESVGQMGREGMRATDVEILNIMIAK